MALRGRAAEQAALDALLDGAAAGRSGVLVVRGEPGIGKTALLGYAEERARLTGGVSVVRATGVETEAEIPFASLHLLLRPALDGIDRLPGPQAAALRAAFGMGPGSRGDELTVGLAVLSLVAEMAAESPLLCLVDDAHWLDHASARALLFAARRLQAEGVALVLGARDGFDPCGLPELRLAGLSPASSAELLAERSPDLGLPLRRRIVEESAGNPLALLELPRTAGAYGPEPLPLPLPHRIQEAYRVRIAALPPGSRTALLVAAAEDGGDLGVILRAADELGVGPDPLGAAERDGLVQVGAGRVAFRHPLMRAAAFHAATYRSRQAAHRVLADLLRDEPDRRAWHLAAAATGYDEEAALALEQAAHRAQQRHGHAGTAAALQRAADLTRDPAARARRLAAAAAAAADAGLTSRAKELIDAADRITADPRTRARLSALRARTAFDEGSPATAHELLLSAAATMAKPAPEAEPRAQADAETRPDAGARAGAVPDAGDRWEADTGTAAHAGAQTGAGPAAGGGQSADARTGDRVEAGLMLVDAARNAWQLSDPVRLREAADRLDALGLRATDGLGAAVVAVAGAALFLERGPAYALPTMRTLVADGRRNRTAGPALRINAAFVAGLVGDFEAGREISADVAADCRARGDLGWLPLAHLTLAASELYVGRFRDAEATAGEGVRLAADTGQPNRAGYLHGILAWLAAVRGDRQQAVQLAARSHDHFEATGIANGLAWAEWALALGDLGQGRFAESLERLDAAQSGPVRHQIQSVYFAPDRVEASARLGLPARVPLEQFAQWAAASGLAWADAVLHRCRALLEPDWAAAHGLFSAAVRGHADSGRPWEAARTRLLFGERLRRERHKAEARPHLRAALRTFERLGAAPWADRARAELRASGAAEPLDVRGTGDALSALSPQELQIVRLAATGMTNREIGAQLFLSPKTVSYHLYRAFPKLNVSSRAQLAGLDLTG
ncbi:LuxR family transcriptional regulator [Actinacidiphila bryophytorum]|uniref:AAA family ATPase n=1 Tax=Actinacidiphila bryophytorum TaxID=1436133 RepID=A0A9W4H5S1_9ACTN|nr:LuxR family transcriptional regulator [Actinacidiphila bryophytorum]MBM9440853.1 AAA family ATPase [Actinacidiphila bryophytorum]MBN6544161.1 AAA family ATPase [Actinacidiphila bryophytorum]CAG7652393.1 AAA family ATPase [Actinacidiphila bryophytorum]